MNKTVADILRDERAQTVIYLDDAEQALRHLEESTERKREYRDELKQRIAAIDEALMDAAKASQ